MGFPVLRDSADIVEFVESRPDMMRLLGAVADLQLPDAWIGAGFVRNAVWDALTGGGPTMLNDVDVVYFDLSDLSAERDRSIEAGLFRAVDNVPWSVKNQARMHGRNGDLLYRDCADAVAHWPETATAVAARLSGGRVELIAPHGIGDLLGLIVRPTPAFAGKLSLYRTRLREKNWQQRWPALTVYDAPQRVSW
jgi:hypothetical protein